MPGKLPDRPYTELMAWQHFLTWRSNQHGKARYELIKRLDPKHAVTVHAGMPSPLFSGNKTRFFYPIDRGNDWFFADDLDGVGTSSFPIWENIDDAGFGMRVEFVKSAARGKKVWLSEVQGGRSAVGFNAYQPVDPISQQRWVWNGIACGAEKILFWCWRNEVFGRESGGFGIAGDDGLAEERLSAMRATHTVIDREADLLAAYQPVQPRVGVLFSPQSYYLAWAQEETAERIAAALQGYTRALVRRSIPYTVVEEEHLEVLDGLSVLFLPHVIVTTPAVEQALENFVRRGGTLVCESECGAFDAAGIYRYPEDRFTVRLAGIHEIGRRNLLENHFLLQNGPFEGRPLRLGMTQWMTPWKTGVGRAWSEFVPGVEEGSLVIEAPVGMGRLVLIGTYLGEPYFKQWNGDFERFVERICRISGWQPEIQIQSPEANRDTFVYIKYGSTKDQRIVFVFFPLGCDQASIRFREGYFRGNEARELLTNRTLTLAAGADGQTLTLSPGRLRIAIIAGAAG